MAGRATSTQRPDRSKQILGHQPEMAFSYMPRLKPTQVAEDSVVQRPIVQRHVRATPITHIPSPIARLHAEMVDISRQGRAKVAGCGPQPAAPRASTCSVTVGKPQTAPPSGGGHPTPTRNSPPSRSAATARDAAAKRAEKETRDAIARFRPFLRVAAVAVLPKKAGPDPFGLGRHSTSGGAPGAPARAPTTRTTG